MKTEFYGIDFVKYSKSGFLFTPEKYNGDYESIGIVTVVLYPSANYKLKKEPYANGSDYSSWKWEIDDITISQGLDSLYNFAIGMGADAIVNFSSRDVERNYNLIAIPVNLRGIELYGFAIRRKK